MKKVDDLRRAFFVFLIFLATLIVLTPTLIRDGFSIFPEEFLEGSLIFLLLLIGWMINLFYEREMRRQDRMLREAWQHIGAVNLLVERFRVALTDEKKYPVGKAETRSFAGTIFEKVRGVLPAESLLLRVVETEKLKTVFEYGDGAFFGGTRTIKIGNKDLVGGWEDEMFQLVGSQENPLHMKTFIIFPKIPMDGDKQRVVQKIINDFTLVYIISSHLL